MKRCFGLTLLAVVLLLAASAGTLADMVVKVNSSKPDVLRKHFNPYGFKHTETVQRDKDGFHFVIKAVKGSGQAGVYSNFTLSGDAEASCFYEVKRLPQPRTGYGCLVGLGFDIGEKQGRGSIQRAHTVKGETGYVLEVDLVGVDMKPEDKYKFVKTKAMKGRIGLRRVGKELIFLMTETQLGDLEEIGRLPFTDKTIRAVRYYGDSGGSPTAVDVWVKEIEVKAEEAVAGIPKSEKPKPNRWWIWVMLSVVVAGGLVGWWRWNRKRSEE